MQRFFEVRRDQFGNPAAGLSCTVYLTGTSFVTKASLFLASDTADTATNIIANPVITGADGIVAFAIADGDYDLVFVGADGATETRVRANFFDSTTSTTIPVSSISLTMPAEFTVAGSPGTSIGITKATETANTVWAGPTTGAAAAPTFRVIVTADVSGVACTLTGVQTVAGAKTFSDAGVFSSTLGVTGTATFTGAITVGSSATITGNVVLAKTAKFLVDTASPDYPWKSTLGIDQGIITGLTGPTATAFQGSQYAWLFSETTINSRMYVIEFPYDYEAGSDIYLFVDWSPNGTNTLDCRWGFEYSIIKSFDQGVFPAPSTLYVTTAGQGTQYRLQTSTTAVITGTNYEPGTKIMLRLFRDASNGADTLTVGAFLHGCGMRYKASRPGTKNKAPAFYS